MKRCGCCEQTKPIEEFSRDRHMRDGRDPRCKVCRSKRRKTGRPSGRRDPALAHYTPEERRRRSWLLQHYKMDLIAWEAMLAAQGGGCAICGATEQLQVDHDHACCPGENTCGKCVRGILCRWHNVAMGALDSPLFDRMVEYKSNNKESNAR